MIVEDIGRYLGSQSTSLEIASAININLCASFTKKAGGILRVSCSQIPSLITIPWTADPDTPERFLENPAGTASP